MGQSSFILLEILTIYNKFLTENKIKKKHKSLYAICILNYKLRFDPHNIFESD
jgi:hypothetical protein